MNKLVQMGAQYGANRIGIQDNPLVKVGLAALDPIGTAIKAFAPSVNEALGAAPGTAEAVANPKGFLKDLAKDVGKDYLRERSDIPVEDRSRSDPSDSGSRDYDTASMGGGKSFFDEEGMSTSAMKRGGKVKSATKSNTASRRGDGIAQRGKTRGRYL
jgi:hypothetical protein